MSDGHAFRLVSDYTPTGDQPQAISALVAGIEGGRRHQVLLGATGTGKTFTMANVIERVNKPTLIISHNKTLAAQLYEEMKELFPDNAVSYFVSYYDYYQPEAYIPQRDIYIEKDASRNDDLDRLRLAATSSLLSRSDVIIVASVSCIFGLGSPEEYRNRVLPLAVGDSPESVPEDALGEHGVGCRQRDLAPVGVHEHVRDEVPDADHDAEQHHRWQHVRHEPPAGDGELRRGRDVGHRRLRAPGEVVEVAFGVHPCASRRPWLTRAEISPNSGR